MYADFSRYKGNLKKYKGKNILIFMTKNTIDLILLVSSSPRMAFLKSTQVERHPYWHNCITSNIACTVACASNLAKNYMRMQFCQYGCHSTRLDFRNAVLGDEDPELNKSIVFCTIKIRLDFPLYFLEFPLYLLKSAYMS